MGPSTEFSFTLFTEVLGIAGGDFKSQLSKSFHIAERWQRDTRFIVVGFRFY